MRRDTHGLRKELYAILEPYDMWWEKKGEPINAQAKEALYDFYSFVLKKKIDKLYNIRDLHHLSYLVHLLQIRKAFEEERYYRVCNELMTLVHDESFYQPRIYYNVIRLLERYLIHGGVNHAKSKPEEIQGIQRRL